MAYFHFNNLLQSAQQGFSTGRFTVMNMLTTDTYITKAISADHPFDILIFDFKKAFHRASHRTILVCPLNLGVVGDSLCWFASFLS